MRSYKIEKSSKNFRKTYKDFAKSIFKLNNIRKISAIRAEIFTSENNQIVVNKTKNYENVPFSVMSRLMDDDIFLTIGDRKSISIIYHSDDEEIILYFKDNIKIPDMENVILNYEKDEFSMNEFEINESNL
jgi:hypothetical protein